MRKFYLISAISLAVVILSYGNVTHTAIVEHVEADSLPKKSKKDPIVEDIKRLMPPVPSSFSPADSARLIYNWTLGIKFYKAKCASCHGIFGKGKDSIPNFSKEQMDDYKMAFLAGDKLNHAVMAQMNTDELNAVFLFITNVRR